MFPKRPIYLTRSKHLFRALLRFINRIVNLHTRQNLSETSRQTIDSLSIVWKSDRTDKMKRSRIDTAVRMHYLDAN